MNKYLLFFILLFSLTASAQKPNVAKSPVSQNIKWDEQESFVNGYARVLRSNKFSFINKSGNLISAVEFDAARNFSNHLAAVKKDDKWGYINESGKLIIPFKYEIVFDFNANVTAVFGNKKWWLINTKAAILKALDISVFYGFNNGIAKIDKEGKLGTMNLNGEIIFDKIQNNFSSKKPITNTPQSPNGVNAISICPENIDFEYGSFVNWKCYTGQVDSVGTTNVITVTPSPPTVNRHTIYNRILPSPLDPFGLFPVNPPDGSNFALRLGNTVIGAQAERVRYTINVPALDSNFSIKYDYAVVFEDPGHTVWTQPRFQVNVFDSAANQYVDCASFEYISTSNLPGFTRSVVDTGVMYKPWSTVFLSLRGYAGKTMYLEFTNADCVRRGHWGYSYIDVEKPCGQAVQMQYDCTAPNITTLTGPPGFEFYNWWDQTFATLLGTGQQIILNPGPAINTTIWLEMIPFNNFGCLDTIPVKITGEFTADFSSSDTTAICAPHTFTFYNRNLPSVSAVWDFGDGTTGTGDTVTHTYLLPGNYIVRLNVAMAGGCNGVAEKLVAVVQPVGSFTFSGGPFCNNSTVQFNAITGNTDTLIWNFGDGVILQTTQASINHTYNTAGIFVPTLTLKSSKGCETLLPANDTVTIEIIKSGFINDEIKVCGSTTLNFTDTSSAYFGIASRQWNFGDGNTGSGINVSHTYTTSGTYNVRLIVTGTSGCIDTVIKPIYVKVNNFPVASITGDTAQCQSVPVTFNSVIASADAINYYSWTSSNGFSGSGNSLTLTFNTPGNYTIQLITRTVNGCADTALHQINIKPTPNIAQPPGQILCNGDFTLPINFTGSVSGTIYNWTNTAPIIGLAASGTGNVASFQASSNGGSVANAGITVTPTANGCPGPSKIFVITVNPTPNVAQPAGQAVCNGATVNGISFTGNVSGTSFSWTNNNTAIGLASSGDGNINSFVGVNNTASPITATITVSATSAMCNGPAKTFDITINPDPTVDAKNNAVVCLGNTVQLSATGAAQYTWTPAVNLSCANCANPIAKPIDSVIYKVKGTSTFGCEAFDSVVLNVIKPFEMQVLPGDTLCFGESLILKAINANSYLWSPPAGLNRTNIANPTAKPGTTTTYQVIGFDGHNCFTDTGYVLITVGPKPRVNLGPDKTLSTGTILSLNAVIQNGPIINWLWTPAADLSCNNCPSPSTIVKNNSFYSVVVTNTFGCTATDTIFINSFCKSSQVYIPNAFTPDGDGLNDVLMVRGKGVTVKSFRIFNRWGELVFERENFYPNDLKFGWNGKVRGIPATPDVFVYTAEVFCDNDVIYTYKGNITILK